MLSERNTSDFNITDKDGKPRTTPCTQGEGLPRLVPCAVISALLKCLWEITAPGHVNGHFHSRYQNFS